MAEGALLSMLGGGWRRNAAERRRTMALAALTAAALLLHAGLLGTLEGGRADEAAPGAPVSALTVRMVAPILPAPAIPPTAEPLTATPPAPDPPVAAAVPLLPPPGAARTAPPRLLAPAAQDLGPIQATAPSEPLSKAEAVSAPSSPGPPADRRADVADVQADAAPEPPAGVPAEALSLHATRLVSGEPAAPAPVSDTDRELPVYRTRIPPSIHIRYQLRRGALSGSGDFHWLPNGDHYEARLEGRVAGVAVLTQASQGGFDEAGVAPLRFTERRAAGALQAANFQRDVGKISFSGPGVTYPLLIGSQDRLSWMVQLAAVVAAEPQRLQDGGKVVIHVVGARGDSRLWVFRFAGREGVRTGAGIVQAAHFVREPAEPYDTRVDVWLDPLRHHLPARALLRSGPDDDGLELLLQEAQP